MKKKVALITGSTRGIGRAIAIKLAKEGYCVVINGVKNGELLSQLEHEIKSYGSDCLSYLGDIGSYENACELFHLIKERFGSIDIVINNAGISYVGLFTDMSKKDWDKLISTNLNSIFNCCHLAVPSMISQKAGKIINISSVWGCVGASCEVAYSATKGAVNSFTKALAKELAPCNIQVNAIACGAIDTDMNRCFSIEEIRMIEEEIPSGRMGSVDEVAELVFDLCKGHSYLTGQIIKFDGAWI